MPVPAKPTLKDPKDFRLLGKPLNRLDTPAKVNGTAKFGIDAQVPGLLVAVMARAPHARRQADERERRARPRPCKGVQQVITHAERRRRAGRAATGPPRRGATRSRSQWDLGPATGLSSTKVSEMLAAGAANADAVGHDSGNLTRRRRQQRRHARCHLRGALPRARLHGADELHRLGQGRRGRDLGRHAEPGPGAGHPRAGRAGRRRRKVKVNTLMLGGGFGRRFAPDFTIDATLLSQASAASRSS